MMYEVSICMGCTRVTDQPNGRIIKPKTTGPGQYVGVESWAECAQCGSASYSLRTMAAATVTYGMPYGRLNAISCADLLNVWVGMSGEPCDTPKNRQRLARAWHNNTYWYTRVGARVWTDNGDIASCEVMGIGTKFARVGLLGRGNGRIKLVSPDMFVIDRFGRVS